MILAKECIKEGGSLKPLLVPRGAAKGPSLSNPTIIVETNQILVNIRNLNYVLYHSENNKFEHIWGPLCYLHQENDQRLVTYNILCSLDNNLNVRHHDIIDTSLLDETPLWEFVGLEDGRLIKWEDKLFLCGVRRDTTTNGVGRMELSEVAYKADKILETSRLRIPAPGNNDSYCEKNWMPVLDKPYTFIKWTNPTEVVQVDTKEKTCTTIKVGVHKPFNCGDLRGGSQVVFVDGYYLALVHEVDLFSSEAGRKNAIYTHRFVVWNKDFDLLEISEKFSFMGAKIEFCCGMAEWGDSLLITFGFQDNAGYILKMPKLMIKGLLKTYA